MVILFLLIFCQINFVFNLKINLKDNYFVDVYLGYPKQKFKFLVDPLSPFSYILKIYYSKTKIQKGLSEIKSFSNSYGEFAGVWVYDKIYLTEDKNFNFKFKFLDCNFKRTLLNVDGVLGLGYSPEYNDTSIYYYLHLMKDVFNNVNKLMSYDRINNLVTIGESSPLPENPNPIKLVLSNHTNYTGYYVDLNKISIESTNFEIQEQALLGLIPMIIAPRNRSEWVKKDYLSSLTYKNNNTTIVKDKKKIFSDVYSPFFKKDLKAKIYFDETDFEYDYYEKKNDTSIRSTVRIGDVWQNQMKCWYVGIPLVNIDRADFNFESHNEAVTLYRHKDFKKSLIPPIIKIGLFVIGIILFLFSIISICLRNQK